MLITVDDRSISFAGRRFVYGAYYFDDEEYKDLRPAEIMARILEQWRQALIANPGDGRTFFLPFELDDECVECLQATSEGEMLALRYVWVDENGYFVKASDLSSFMVSDHGIQKDLGEVGKYKRDEFLAALGNPEIQTGTNQNFNNSRA